MLVHKLRAPFQPELAIGSVDESGRVDRTPFAADLAIDERVLDAEKRAQLATLKQRRQRYTAARAPLDVAGRTVILVDDGLATGSTANQSAGNIGRLGEDTGPAATAADRDRPMPERR
jgi:predicted phosphoribosyltransferase